jgi:hypothetical protein
MLNGHFQEINRGTLKPPCSDYIPSLGSFGAAPDCTLLLEVEARVGIEPAYTALQAAA